EGARLPFIHDIAGWMGIEATRSPLNLSFVIALLGAFALAYNFRAAFVPAPRASGTWFVPFFLPLCAMAVPIKVIVFGWMRQYRGSWRYVGLRDLLDVIRATHVSSFLFVTAYFVLENVWEWDSGHRLIDHGVELLPLRQSVFLLDWAGTIGLVSLCRMVVRLYQEEVRAEQSDTQTRVLILGAGDTGEAVLREILRMPRTRFEVVGFLDDRSTEHGRTIHGVEVLGLVSDIRDICGRYLIEEILIAMPKATPRQIRNIVEICEGANLRFRIVPAVEDVIEGRLQVSQLRNVDIEDLLGRDPVELDTKSIAEDLSDNRILVTGAGGSIGSEMCRQIAAYKPQRLILVEQAEHALFEIDRELRSRFEGIRVTPYVADICDTQRIRSIFRREKPTTIFHAAAHKHVPMMEINPGEAIKNNIVGTRTVADAAVDAGIAKVVIISTDKAVNPTSIMGCSKRVAEMYVQQLSTAANTQFITVRFGNVLGSSGSVVPIFRRQIADGGPLTVTHPDMMRFFMTISEAAQLVLQAGTMGTGGEIFVLDMGDPVKIVDLAKDMITLSGYRPGIDIDIEFTGPRPGEKLIEELAIAGENVSRTKHAKIGIWENRPEDFAQVCAGIDRLVELADSDSAEAVRAELKRVVPEYHEEAFPDPVAADQPSVESAPAKPALGV
ncbi:MAG: polysaccharide biosynthesis protein, partial [Planctomycetes bacterium]|nr:polysaccharide biosynthesis protein [Planctomycetota bacterium]